MSWAIAAVKISNSKLLLIANMAQTLTELLGSNASLTTGTLSVSLSDLVDGSGNPLLDSPSSATATQAIAALLSHLHRTTKPATDTEGNETVDETDAIVSTDSFTPKTFEVRNEATQIRHDFNFFVYTTDSTGFDPDNVV